MALLNSLILFLFISIISNAQTFDTVQNLVVNPSFEEHTKCPGLPDRLKYCIGWNNVLYSSSPDYFNPCFYDSIKALNITLADNYSVNVPDNNFGYQRARTGKAYVGISTFDKDYSYQEYIQSKLIKPLIEGKRYKITMYVSLAESSTYANDRFRFCLTQDSTFKITEKTKQYPQIESEEGILFKSDTLITDTLNWVRISAVYKAKGSEQYLTIGVFKNDMSKKEFRKKMKHPFNSKVEINYIKEIGKGAYYYIDDVSIIEYIH